MGALLFMHQQASPGTQQLARSLEVTTKHGCFPKLGVPTVMENQMEKKMKNEMETGII